jgi:hypothetical protein
MAWQGGVGSFLGGLTKGLEQADERKRKKEELEIHKKKLVLEEKAGELKLRDMLTKAKAAEQMQGLGDEFVTGQNREVGGRSAAQFEAQQSPLVTPDPVEDRGAATISPSSPYMTPQRSPGDVLKEMIIRSGHPEKLLDKTATGAVRNSVIGPGSVMVDPAGKEVFRNPATDPRDVVNRRYAEVFRATGGNHQAAQDAANEARRQLAYSAGFGNPQGGTEYKSGDEFAPSGAPPQPVPAAPQAIPPTTTQSPSVQPPASTPAPGAMITLPNGKQIAPSGMGVQQPPQGPGPRPPSAPGRGSYLNLQEEEARRTATGKNKAEAQEQLVGLQGASALVDELDHLSKGLSSKDEASFGDRAIRGARQYTRSYDPASPEGIYESRKQTVGENLARNIGGVKGTATEGDIYRMLTALPRIYGETESSRAYKIAAFREIINTSIRNKQDFIDGKPIDLQRSREEFRKLVDKFVAGKYVPGETAVEKKPGRLVPIP